MNKLASLALLLPLAACTVGDSGSTGTTGDDTPGDDGGGSGSGSNTGGGISGHITAPTTWSGAVDITGDVTIDAGVSVTVAAGAQITVATGTGITVKGTLDVQGTAASKVHIGPKSTGGHFANTNVPTGGTLTMAYTIQEGGGITTQGSGKVTVTDSQMSKAQGDWLIMSGGNIDISYSWIGLETGLTDSTHCDMHFGGAGNTIKFTHNNVSTSTYGIMFYGGTSADFTYNNWFSNTTDIDTQPGVQGDISNGWFEKGVPTAGPGATLTSTANAAARLPDAGPRG